MSAALFSVRQGMSTLVITKDLGGQMSAAHDVENYLGITSETGPKLTDIFYNHLKKYPIEFHFAQASGLKKQEDIFSVLTELKEFEARAVILAFGLTPNSLDVPGEKEFLGSGVSYSALACGDKFSGKPAAVVGGGNSAVEAACYLAKICSKIYLIHRRQEFRAESEAQKRLNECPNLEVLFDRKVIRIEGSGKVEKIIFSPSESDAPEESLEVSAIFICVGYKTNTGWISGDLVEKNERGEIIIDSNCRTKTPGLFAAGDITNINYKQIQISAGEGAEAALRVSKYLAERKGKKISNIDWSQYV